MTKTIILGEQSKSEALTPIEFLYCLGSIDWDFSYKAICSAEHYKYIELIASNFLSDKKRPIIKYDLIFAYDDPKKREEGTLYAGHWNDGVV